MEEVWKDIIGFEEYYQISNLGRVRSLDRLIKWKDRFLKKKGKIHKQSFNQGGGYKVTYLCRGGLTKVFTIHRLVAIHFVENPFNYDIINHIDGNKQNNRSNNLEWCTQLYNVRHAIKTGLRRIRRGVELKQSKITEIQVKEIRKLYEDGFTKYRIAKLFPLSQEHVANIIERKVWKHI